MTEHPTKEEATGVLALRNALVASDPTIEATVNSVASQLLSGHHHVDAWPEEGDDDAS